MGEREVKVNLFWRGQLIDDSIATSAEEVLTSIGILVAMGTIPHGVGFYTKQGRLIDEVELGEALDALEEIEAIFD